MPLSRLCTGAAGKSAAVLVLLLGALVMPAMGAGVKPLEIFSDKKLLDREVERLANEHALSSGLVRKAVDRLNKEMNISTRERTQASLKLLATARETMTAAMRSSAALSGYVAASSGHLKTAGYSKYLPLARLDKEIERPYYEDLDRFFATAADFIQYCNDNYEAIATGQAAENRQYDRRYAAYVKEMETFNARSDTRSQQLADWGNDYPSLWELLPR